MKIVEKLNQKQIKQLHQLYQEQWWTKNRTLEETIKVVNNSTLIYAIIDNDENLIAFVRVLSDYTFKTMIFDLIVNELYKRQGLGKKLLEHIHSHPKLKTTTKELYCLPQMQSYYEKFGYKDLCDELVLMRLKNI